MSISTTGCHGGREFDILLFSTTAIQPSVIREFEDLPLRIALCLGTSAHEQCSPRATDTMLQSISTTEDGVASVTSRAHLLVNVSQYTISSTTGIIEACISTGTTYVDGCTDPLILAEIRRCFPGPLSIKVIPGCAGAPFLVDLCVLHMGQDHNIRDIECTIKPHSAQVGFYSRISACAQLAQGGLLAAGLRYNDASGTYEAPLAGVVREMLGRSRRYFTKKGMPLPLTKVYVSVGSTIMAVAYLLVAWISALLRPERQVFADEGMQLEFAGSTAEHKPTVRLKVTTPSRSVSALCIAQVAASIVESDDNRGGVLTPAMALHRTKMIERLAYKGMEFHHFLQ